MPGTTTLNDSQTRERAGQAKDVAVERSGQVASTAKDSAAQVAGEAKAQVSTLAGQARDSVREQSLTQRDRLVDTVRAFASDLDRMATNADSSGPAADLVRQLSSRAHGLASGMENREPADLLDGVRDFARRRPAVFLLGAAVAGVLAGRATRGARAAQQTTSGTDTTAWSGTTSYGTPSTVGASATPIGDSAAAAVAATQSDPSYQPSPTGIGWDAAEEDPDLGPTNYGGPTGGNVARAVDLREVTGERELAPVPENSPDDGFGEALEPDRSGQRSME